MVRKRNPEETKRKILEVAKELFLEKGYDNTSVQDIIDGLGGMTKGALYHHFKSKYDILDTILDNVSKKDMELFEEGKNGLENLRNLFLMSLKSYSTQSLVYSAAITLKSPRFIGEQYLNILDLSKQIEKFFKQGMKDGSIETEYPEEISEILLIYANMRIGLHLADFTKEEAMRKFVFLKEMLDRLGVPIIDEEIIEEAEKLYDYLHRKK